MRLRNARRHGRQATVSGLAIAAVTFASYELHFNAATVVLLYLLVIVWQSLAGSFVLSALISVAAAVCLDFFFLPPLLSLHIADPLNVLAFVVFLVIALVVNHLVSRLGAAADGAQRRGANLEQLHDVTRHLLLAKPDHNDACFLLKTFREGFAASAACLFDGNTAEVYVDGTPRSDLPARTRQAYVA
jgi:two-component system sensor histidine kinase KdpD